VHFYFALDTSYLDEKYVGDVTYISTGEEWLYLATVIDLCSRRYR
jgi:transposase InsO family protein